MVLWQTWLHVWKCYSHVDVVMENEGVDEVIGTERFLAEKEISKAFLSLSVKLDMKIYHLVGKAILKVLVLECFGSFDDSTRQKFIHGVVFERKAHT